MNQRIIQIKSLESVMLTGKSMNMVKYVCIFLLSFSNFALANWQFVGDYVGPHEVMGNEIYLPEGEWIDFFDETIYKGSQTMNYHAPIDRVPILVKAGSIIPMGPDGQNYMDENTSQLTIHVYPKGSSYFKLYEDDGKSYDYEKGVHAISLFSCKEKKGELLIKKYKPKGTYEIPKRNHVFCVHNIDEVTKVMVKNGAYPRAETKNEYDQLSNGWYI